MRRLWVSRTIFTENLSFFRALGPLFKQLASIPRGLLFSSIRNNNRLPEKGFQTRYRVFQHSPFIGSALMRHSKRICLACQNDAAYTDLVVPTFRSQISYETLAVSSVSGPDCLSKYTLKLPEEVTLRVVYSRPDLNDSARIDNRFSLSSTFSRSKINAVRLLQSTTTSTTNTLTVSMMTRCQNQR